MSVQPGDLLAFTDGTEAVRVVRKNSTTSLVVERGYWDFSPAAPAHASGATLRTTCSAAVLDNNHAATATPEMNWAFLQSADASNATYYGIRSLGGSHTNYRPTMWIADVLQAAMGDITDPATWQRSNDYPATFNPTFAGAMAEESPEHFETHPSYHNNFATGLERLWVVDTHPLSGGLPMTISAVSGDLYKVSGITDVSVLFPRIFDIYAFAANKILRDISGPGSSILTTSGDNYKFCIALMSNECRSGSSPGDVYANVPGLTTLACGNVLDFHDLCINNKGMRGLSIDQARVRTGLTTQTAITTQRTLTRLFTTPKVWPNTSNARSLPDGSWVFYSPAAGPGAVMIKIPPQPAADGKDRTTFIPTPIAAAAPPGATHAVVEFGYAEQGTPASYYCTSRRETCVAYQAAVNEATPFKWTPTESVTGLPCSPSCTLVVPALPGRVVYWRVKYRNANQTDIALGESGVAIEGSLASTATTP
jgi:hypothetical protein